MKNGMKQTEIGEIPVEWEVVKLKETGNIVSGATPDTKVAEYWDGEIAWCTPTDITALKGKPYISNTQKRISEIGLKKSSAALLPVGSLVICTRATLGDCAINLIPITTNQGFKSIVPNKKWDVGFLYHLINNSKDLIRRLSSGSTFLEISKRAFENIDIVAPPLPEQRKIAEILSTLDEKMAVMDEQLAQTQELKKGLMQRLLAKGIGHTQFKDSPLGEIPASWEFNVLEDCAKCMVGIASSATHAYTNKGILLLRNQNIKEGWLDLKDVLYVTEDYELQHKNKRLKAGDILTVRTGYPGISAVVPKELENSQSFTTLIIRPNPKMVLSEYLCYYINSEMGKSYFNNSKAGGGQQNVGSKTLEKMSLPLPPLPDQRQIAEILTTVDEKIGVLQDKKVQYQTLKRGLMQQLLTGQRRVRVPALETAVLV